MPEQGHEGVGRRDPRNIIISVPSASSHDVDRPEFRPGQRAVLVAPSLHHRCPALPAPLADYSQNLRGCRRRARAWDDEPSLALTRRRAAAWIA